MDRDLLSRMIIELVATHDIVGLPGVGTFVTEEISASFSDKGFTINPPYRKLSFKPKCLEDQLLVEFYSTTNNVPIEIAQGYIYQFLSSLKDILQDRKTVVLPGLGRLRATRENNFFFVAEENLNISPDAFGLDSVSLRSHPLIDEKVDIPFDFLPATGLPRPEGLAMTNEEVAMTNEEVAMTEKEIAMTKEDVATNTPVIASSVCDEAISGQEEVVISEERDCHATLAMTEKEVAMTDEAISGQEEIVIKKKFKWWIIPIVLIIIAIIAFAAFYILAQVAPDFIDSILYTPEELWIINY